MISIRPPSIQGQYDDFWSGDPAFVQLPADASDEQRNAHVAKWQRFRSTGDASELLIEGQTPTKFVMRPVRGDQWRWLVDESTREDEHKMGMAVFWQLMFRCACVRVVNLGTELPEKPARHPQLGHIAPLEIPNALDSIDASIVTELAGAAFERARNLNPL